ncbi:MAG: hypothetical protein JF571_07435 [Asticcacaulis sp.]|nr:hypothetical protein [Asticcacaulis sp.]
MAFKSKTPKGLTRKKGLQTHGPMKTARPAPAPAPPTFAEQRAAEKKALQRTTLRLLEKARREAAERGIDLSEWESEFLDSVSERIKTYGRAFADPDKGASGGTLSLRQGVKLKEIRKKARSAKPAGDDGGESA